MINETWPWWLDGYVFMATAMVAFAALILVLGCIPVAIDGRDGWNSEIGRLVLLFVVIGILFPLAVFLPFIALGRALLNK